jgi:cystathionine beta-lyase/cystathionine gamma-synthase
MRIHSKAVHAGDRKRTGGHVPVTTPIYTATSYFYDEIDTLDKVFAQDVPGYAYSRYHNPTNEALEELVASLENGAGALATSSGMMAIQVALQAALLDRNKVILAASALYGATIKLLDAVMEPFGCEVHYVDVGDLGALTDKIRDVKPGCLLMETVSNPMLRVGELDRIAELAKSAGAALIVDNTFATPLLVRPLELGASISVHSATKYLSGHGDVLGGFVVADESHIATVRALSRISGPVMGPFNAYLAMRGIKTFPLRMERQCRNAGCVFEWLRQHPRVSRAIFTGDAAHPDAATIRRLMPEGLTGAMISFEIREASRDDVFSFLDRLRMIVPATSLGDVHTMILYPAMSSHRDLAPRQRERMGISDRLVRLSVGIEDPEDIVADLEKALG